MKPNLKIAILYFKVFSLLSPTKHGLIHKWIATYRAVRCFPHPTNGRIRVLDYFSDHAAKTDLFQGHREANGQDRQESRHCTLL
jgi:hypothetical protein